MGSSGVATGAHLHFDVIEGLKDAHWRLADYKAGKVTPAPAQLALALNRRLFKVYPVVTSSYNDPLYPGGAVHSAFDVVPEDRQTSMAHWKIFWPYNESGMVTYIGHDNGYGYSLMIAFEA
jgi:murein DD-endopeptidase MepM/ murein hydrolase activator NlpD